MFCNRCYYDLRGQAVERCPECGTTFDFDDSGSHLANRPGPFGRVLLRLQRRRRALLIVLTVLLMISYAVASHYVPRFANHTHPVVLSRQNLKAALTAWTIQQYDDPEQLVFDVTAAEEDIQPSLSPWSEADAAWRRALVTYILTHGYLFAIPALVFLAALAVLVRGRTRRAALALMVASAFMVVGAIYPRETAARVCPGTYAFLDDYVYLRGVVMTSANPTRGRTIAAYDKKSFRRVGRGVIGFAAGNVVTLLEERARPLFEAQGLPYPQTSPSSE